MTPLFLGCLLSACLSQSQDRSEEGTASGTESSFALSGNLVFPGGNPCRGAEIRLYEASKTGGGPVPGAFKTAARSDNEGHYRIPALPRGLYALRAEYADSATGDTLTAIRREIFLAHSEDVGSDTLKRPGRIAGRVMAGEKPLFGAWCFIPGTSSLATTDSLGNCLITHVPPGDYEVAFQAGHYLTAAISPVRVESGRTVLLNAISLSPDPYGLPPMPAAPQAAYDSLTGVVALRWNKVELPDPAGYLVYRDDISSARPTLISGTVVKDTVFLDTLYRESLKPDSAVYAYRVRTVDRNGNESPFGDPVIVKIVAPPGLSNPYPGNRSEAMDTALTLRWSLRSITGKEYLASVMLDTLSPPSREIGEGIRLDSLGLDGRLRPGRTYFWRVVLAGASGRIEGPIWSFQTDSVETEAGIRPRFVDVRGTTGHLRLDARGGPCAACSAKPAFSGPLTVSFGPADEPMVVQLYKDSRPTPVFPPGNPNALSPSGTVIGISPGIMAYELKAWKPGESAPRIAFWFTSTE